MREYHKIDSLYQRTERGQLLLGQYSEPEFRYLAENEWVFTEKVDGQNIRVMYEAAPGLETWSGPMRADRRRSFGGKTDAAQLSVSLVPRLGDLFPVAKLAEAFPWESDTPAPQVCLYGEGYGAKIQKGGRLYRPDQSFVLFDVWINGWWLKREDVEDIAHKLNIDVVPIIGTGTLQAMEVRVWQGFNSQWGPFPAEGIVARPAVELRTRRGDRVITKLKTRDFRNAIKGE